MKIEYGPDSGIQRLKDLRTTKELVAAHGPQRLHLGEDFEMVGLEN